MWPWIWTELATDRQGELSPENRRVIESAIERGVHVVIASYCFLRHPCPKKVLSILGIEWAITCNGAAVYQVPEGGPLPPHHDAGVHRDHFPGGRPGAGHL